MACKKLGIEDENIMYSFSAFKKNEAECLNYFKEKDIVYIDEEYPEVLEDLNFSDDIGHIKLFIDKFKVSKSEIVTAVPPCGGLSLLNSSKSRGSDADVNKFIYFAIKFYLASNSDVLVLENAPGLTQKMGFSLLVKLYELIEKLGFKRKIQLVRTTTINHGIPQNRIRTFLYVHKKDGFVKLKNKIHDTPNLLTYLESFTYNADDEMSYCPGLNYDGPEWLEEIKNIGLTNDKNRIKSAWQLILDKGIDIKEFKDEKLIRFYNHIKNKMSIGLGFWDGSPLFPKDRINGLISKNGLKVLHPKNYSRYLTMRECMNLMGIPIDFNLADKARFNVICQNIPVNTAADAIKWAIEILENDADIKIKSKFLLQKNINMDLENDIVEWDNKNEGFIKYRKGERYEYISWEDWTGDKF